MEPTWEAPPAEGRPGENVTTTETRINDPPAAEQDLEKRPAEKLLNTSTSVSSSADKKDDKGGQPAPASNTELEAALEQLPEDERAILKEQLDSPTVPVTFFGLYRYADASDYIVLAISALASIAAGAALPLFTVGKTSPATAFAFANIAYRSFSEH
jgi:ATP-binding cassette subfamily B (MDR/TAP) protein 1